LEIAALPQRNDGNAPDQDFPPEENLYRRYLREHFVNGELRAQHFQLPEASVNRERYSDGPEDVLHQDCCGGEALEGYGILGFTVADVEGVPWRPVHATNDQRSFEFFPFHEPEPSCRPHTEILCRDEATRQSVAKPPKSVKEQFRIHLAGLVSILRDATR
jgi:hypothetical protein